MSAALLTIDGFYAYDVTVHVPAVGVWVLTGKVSDDAFVISERKVTATIGTQSFVGTIDLQASGEFLLTKQVRIIGGSAGWRKSVKHAGYHNDAGVKRQTLAAFLAKQSGEVLGDSASGIVGVDYAWKDGKASEILEAICPEWRVAYDGKTYLNSPTATAAASDIVPLDYDKHAQTVSLGIYENIPAPGNTITDERFGTVTIRSLTIRASASGISAVAWFGSIGRSRLGNALESIAKGTNRGLFGIYRYRVVSMATDNRVNLQAVKSDLGLPDMMPISQCPGLPGFQADLSLGSIVLVQFLDGDPSLPRVTGYDSSTPTALKFGGGDRPFARIGDAVMVYAGAVAIATFNGFTGPIVFGSALPGAISTGRTGFLG